MRTAVYLRQTIDRLGDGLAIGRQREDCLQLCADRGWEPIEYVDNDTSASTGRRPAYQRMLADIEAGSIRAVVAWDLDRLHRRPIELENFIELANRHGLGLATVGGEADLSTDNGRLFARIKGAVARAEVERKSARQKRTLLQRAQSGRPWGPQRPFGYNRDGSINPVEARRVRDAYNDVLAGVSMASIAKAWNSAGITSTLGNKWTGAALHQMLERPRYAGLRAYNGEIVGKAEWDAVVTEDIWRSALEVLKAPGRIKNPTPGRKYLLTGIASCGGCANTLGSGINSQTKAPIYVCRTCHKIGRRQSVIDELIVAIVVGRLSRPDATELIIDNDRPDIEHLRAEAAALRARLDILSTEFADGDLTASQLRTATERIKSKRAKAEAAMIDASKSHVFAGVVGSEDVSARFASLQLDRRRAIIDSLMTISITPTPGSKKLDPASVQIDWKT